MTVKKASILTIMLFVLIFLTSCKIKTDDPGNGGPIIDPPIEKPKNEVKEFLTDNTFHTGFNLLGVSSVEDKREIKRYLDYDGKAIPTEKPLWYMGQWWTPYNFVDSLYSFVDNKHTYTNRSRVLEVNPDNHGELTMELLGSEEYLGGTRENASDSWAHFLIEQSFNDQINLSQIDKLVVSLDFNISMMKDRNGNKYDPNIHAAQLLWFFTARNYVPDGESFEQSGKNNDYFWFGTPIFDSRHDFVPNTKHIDSGSIGTTNKLIYSMSSREYISEKIKVGKDYHIEIDILPFVKEAFIYAKENNSLVNAKFENMYIDYMNFGWELPGAFDVRSTIKNMSVKTITKNTKESR